jgi:hypothetical protein
MLTICLDGKQLKVQCPALGTPTNCDVRPWPDLNGPLEQRPTRERHDDEFQKIGLDYCSDFACHVCDSSWSEVAMHKIVRSSDPGPWQFDGDALYFQRAARWVESPS